MLNAERDRCRLAAHLIERADRFTLEIFIYFNAEDWGAARSDIDTTTAGVHDSEDAENALFILPQDLTHLRDQQLKQGGTLIELSVPEREPDQTFEIVILAFTRDLPSKEALAIAPGDAQRTQACRSEEHAIIRPRSLWQAPLTAVSDRPR